MKTLNSFTTPHGRVRQAESFFKLYWSKREWRVNLAPLALALPVGLTLAYLQGEGEWRGIFVGMMAAMLLTVGAVLIPTAYFQSAPAFEGDYQGSPVQTFLEAGNRKKLLPAFTGLLQEASALRRRALLHAYPATAQAATELFSQEFKGTAGELGELALALSTLNHNLQECLEGMPQELPLAPETTSMLLPALEELSGHLGRPLVPSPSA